MSWTGVLLRRARLRGLAEGLVQKVRAESTELDSRDAVERFQDYGFSAQPVEGQGLVISAGGHTVVLRMDRLSERPQLDAYEVCVWHREGHKLTLRAGGAIEVDCTTLTVVAAEKVVLDTPLVQATGTLQAKRMVADVSLTGGGKEMVGHRHDQVEPGQGLSGENVWVEIWAP